MNQFLANFMVYDFGYCVQRSYQFCPIIRRYNVIHDAIHVKQAKNPTEKKILS